MRSIRATTRAGGQWVILTCVALGGCWKLESPKSESRPRPIQAAPATRGSIAADQAFASKICAVIRNTVAKAGPQKTSPMVVFALEIPEVFQNPAELTGNEAKIDSSAKVACPDDWRKLLAMVGRESIAEALLPAE